MQDKLLFIIYYRACSHLLLKCLCNLPGFEVKNKGEHIYDTRKLLTKSGSYMCEHLLGDIRDLPNGQNCRYVYVADWWGSISDHSEVPLPYQMSTYSRWGRDELKEICSEWKTVYLLRDPRNHIESLRNTGGEKKNSYQLKDRNGYFIYQCKAARNRMQVAIDAMNEIPNTIGLYSEDLVENPQKFFYELGSFSDIPLDQEAILSAWKEDNLSQAGNSHSTFGTVSGYNNRWKNWTGDEIRTFNEICGQSLIDLGYEKDQSWVSSCKPNVNS